MTLRKEGGSVMHVLVGESNVHEASLPSLLPLLSLLTRVQISIPRHASIQIFPLYSPQLHVPPFLKYSAIQHYVEKVEPYSLWLCSILLLSFAPIS